jgi:hypothetical protein
MGEIAAVVGCSEATIETTFAAALHRGRERTKLALRCWQWRAARAGNVTMLVWLGKQILGQRDTRNHELHGRDGEPVLTLEMVRAVLQATEGEVH